VEEDVLDDHRAGLHVEISEWITARWQRRETIASEVHA
jgi:hypothetical protein